MPRYQQRLWRSTASDRNRWIAIVAAFAVIWVVGLVVVGVVVWVAGLVGLPAEPTWAIWLGLGALLVPFVVRAPTPALVHGEQSWTEFVVRAVVVGEQEPRPLGWRIAAALVFGPGLVGYSIVYAIQALLGLV